MCHSLPLKNRLWRTVWRKLAVETVNRGCEPLLFKLGII